MKALAPEVVRLMQAALETRDTLRSLVAQIDSAGDDPNRKDAVLTVARAVAVTHADLLRSALRDSAARRHRLVAPDAAPMWTEPRERP